MVLGIAFVVEGASFTVALREFNKARAGRPFMEFVRESKDPGLYTVVFEDSAAMLGLVVALLGVFLGHMFENPLFDGLASIVIGLILVGVAWLLAVETKGLLLGEGADAATVKRMHEIVEGDEAVECAGEILTMYMGTHDLIVTIGVQFKSGIHAETIHRAIHRIEDIIEAEFPDVRHVYIEVESLPREAATA